MSKRFQWLKYLLSLTLLIGLSTPTLAAPIDTAPDNGVEGYFWLCLEDNTGRRTEHAVQCCDGAFCYTCTADFKDCWISDDPQASSPPRTGLDSLRPHIRPMQERPSEGQLQSICTSVKANFTKFEGFGYSCLKPSCNGKGEYCAIICHDDDSCAAHTPDPIKGAVSLRGILQNGDNIDRSNSSPATESQGDGDGGNDDGDDSCYGCLY